MQQHHEGEEVDFDESYFFPEWKDTSNKDKEENPPKIALSMAASAA